MKEHILLNWSGSVLRSRRRGERLRRVFLLFFFPVYLSFAIQEPYTANEVTELVCHVKKRILLSVNESVQRHKT